MNLFEINDLNNISVEEFHGSKIFYMDNFYKYPDKILEHLLETQPVLWKGNETPSYNNVHFSDLRHSFDDCYFEHVGTQLSKICNQHVLAPGTIKTNCIKFFDSTFNDYKNNYWAPHRDLGYNAIIYFNSVPTVTNLYEQVLDDQWDSPEHFEPWRSREKYKIIKVLEGKFNRLIMFDGAKFFHGMGVSDDSFFKMYRINQVLFFGGSN